MLAFPNLQISSHTGAECPQRFFLVTEQSGILEVASILKHTHLGCDHGVYAPGF